MQPSSLPCSPSLQMRAPDATHEPNRSRHVYPATRSAAPFAPADNKMTRICALAVLCVGMSLPASAQQYQARRDGDVVRLEDSKNQVVVSILPSVGNQAFELKVKGHNVLRWTY